MGSRNAVTGITGESRRSWVVGLRTLSTGVPEITSEDSAVMISQRLTTNDRRLF